MRVARSCPVGRQRQRGIRERACLGRVGVIVGRHLGHMEPQKLFIRPHGHKRAPKTPQNAQKGTRRPLDAPKTAFATVLCRCWPALGAQDVPYFGYKSAQEAPRGPKRSPNLFLGAVLTLRCVILTISGRSYDAEGDETTMLYMSRMRV